MPRYLFLHDRRDGSFPERYRVVGPGEDAAALQAAEALTGTVPAAQAEAFFEALVARFGPHAPIIAESVHATRWATVARSYAGLFRDD